MRTLPKNKSPKQKIIIKAVYDYFGAGIDRVRAHQIAIFIMGRQKGVELTEEEKSDMRCIRQNLKDKVYLQSLAEDPH